jgi:flavin-dependent dehydrogenase
MSRAEKFDVVIVGARAAGASLAMLLARRGLRVLAVDRSEYGSDTISTHALMRGGVLQLHRWGLLDRVRASGAPPIRSVTFHYPGETVAVQLKASDGIEALFAPRRTVLDRILVDAARDAGAEVRFGVSVSDLTRADAGGVTGISAHDREGRKFEAGAGLVVGADGIRSLVARCAGAPTLRQASAEGAVVYGYFRGIDASGYEWGYGPQISAGLIPTNGGDSCVFVGGSSSRFRSDVLPDLKRGFHALLEQVSPEVAARVRRGTQTARFRGFTGVRGYYRQAYGEGWALLGDAGYFRDPITTHGLTDAFRDAEVLARAIVVGLNEPGRMPEALAGYQSLRDSVTADLFEVTDRIAGYDWTLDELKRHLLAVSRAMKPEVDVILGFDTPQAAA